MSVQKDRPVERHVLSENIQAKDTNVIGRIETKQNNGKQGSKELQIKPSKGLRPN